MVNKDMEEEREGDENNKMGKRKKKNHWIELQGETNDEGNENYKSKKVRQIK